MVGNDPELVGRFVDNIATIAANARTGEGEVGGEQRAKKSVDRRRHAADSLQSNIRTAVANGTAATQMLADADKLDATRDRRAADPRQRQGAR
jgi:hypothetical protein